MSVTKITAFIGTLALTAGFTIVGAPAAEATTTAGVNATPHNMTGHWWSYDGCSVVPDSGTHLSAWYDFHHACIHHDGCYRHRWAGKATCDWWFHNDMRASCSAIHPSSWWARTRCENRAYLYYLGVTYFGWNAYYNRTVYAPMNAYV